MKQDDLWNLKCFHGIYKITTKSGIEYALDLTSPQYGFTTSILQWDDYAETRISKIIPAVKEFSLGTRLFEGQGPLPLHGSQLEGGPSYMETDDLLTAYLRLNLRLPKKLIPWMKQWKRGHDSHLGGGRESDEEFQSKSTGREEYLVRGIQTELKQDGWTFSHKTD
jgi:hypothetical protein